jgi:hypothetical protein
MKYEFSLVLAGAKVDEADVVKLYEAGCDDASILSRDGITKIQFDRIGESLDEALSSAIQDVERTGFKVTRVEIERHEVPQIA